MKIEVSQKRYNSIPYRNKIRHVEKLNKLNNKKQQSRKTLGVKKNERPNLNILL